MASFIHYGLTLTKIFVFLWASVYSTPAKYTQLQRLSLKPASSSKPAKDPNIIIPLHRNPAVGHNYEYTQDNITQSNFLGRSRGKKQIEILHKHSSAENYSKRRRNNYHEFNNSFTHNTHAATDIQTSPTYSANITSKAETKHNHDTNSASATPNAHTDHNLDNVYSVNATSPTGTISSNVTPSTRISNRDLDLASVNVTLNIEVNNTLKFTASTHQQMHTRKPDNTTTTITVTAYNNRSVTPTPTIAVPTQTTLNFWAHLVKRPKPQQKVPKRPDKYTSQNTTTTTTTTTHQQPFRTQTDKDNQTSTNIAETKYPLTVPMTTVTTHYYTSERSASQKNSKQKSAKTTTMKETTPILKTPLVPTPSANYWNSTRHEAFFGSATLTTLAGKSTLSINSTTNSSGKEEGTEEENTQNLVQTISPNSPNNSFNNASTDILQSFLQSMALSDEGHSVCVTWTIRTTTADTDQIEGFVVSYRMEGRENYDSSRLGRRVDTFILHSLHEDKHYRICVQVVGEQDRVLGELCQSWSKTSMKVVMGIIAGSIFLFPCAFIVAWVIIKDKQMRISGQIIVTKTRKVEEDAENQQSTTKKTTKSKNVDVMNYNKLLSQEIKSCESRNKNTNFPKDDTKRNENRLKSKSKRNKTNSQEFEMRYESSSDVEIIPHASNNATEGELDVGTLNAAFQTDNYCPTWDINIHVTPEANVIPDEKE